MQSKRLETLQKSKKCYKSLNATKQLKCDMSENQPAMTDVMETFIVDHKIYKYYSLPRLTKTVESAEKIPFSIKILLENLLRHHNSDSVHIRDIMAVATWPAGSSDHEISYNPARVLMQDFTGVPAVVDLAAMRDATVKLQGDPERINPLCPVDMVIDHSVMVDYFGNAEAMDKNIEMEFSRNRERYAFLRWGQKTFDNFRVVPPGIGICHQVNLEYLAKVVATEMDSHGNVLAYPDTCIGTDSHTTMVNALGVLGWGVGGIEAEAVMLGEPISMILPQVVGFKIIGALKEGVTATDLVLSIVEILRRRGVVGKFVEFFGPGLKSLTLADRATISNMAPEYGATCGIFPIDEETIKYLRLTGRSLHQQKLVERYAKIQGLWGASAGETVYSQTVTLDLSTVETSLAGPSRPQDRVALSRVPYVMQRLLDAESRQGSSFSTSPQEGVIAPKSQNLESVPKKKDWVLPDGAVVLAAITSCTNTSNPSVLVGAGLLAQKAVALGLSAKPWVKTSFAPGSQVVAEYLSRAGLLHPLEQLGFHVVGYGCTTCIGNSGPLSPSITRSIESNALLVNAVLSGNRNFEGRINPQVRGNWLASPLLVVVYALVGTMNLDLTTQPIGQTVDKRPIYLRHIWPSIKEIQETIQKSLSTEMFTKKYATVFEGGRSWRDLAVKESKIYAFDHNSTYIQNPPYFDKISFAVPKVKNVTGAKILLALGDSITTDHISPAGSFAADTPAGKYLLQKGIKSKDFNSFGARRGNHEIMMRGTFANIRLRNALVPEKEGGFTRINGEIMSVYDAAIQYAKTNTPLCVFAGREYGTGSSRDWAAKGTRLLGIKFVVAESFERIHRTNLVGMGVLPLMFKNTMSWKDLQLRGTESIDILGLEDDITPGQDVRMVVTYPEGRSQTVDLHLRIDTTREVDYYRNGGILHYILRKVLRS